MKFNEIGVNESGVCGLLTNDRVDCWFNPTDDGANGVVTKDGMYSQLSSGDDPSGLFCALHPAGEASCWGDNPDNVLDGPGTAFRHIYAGTSAICGLRKSDDAVECWGSF